MVSAINLNHKEWLRQSRENYSEVKSIDLVVGITYGTELTTNNKENQILAKLQEHGFVEEDRVSAPGVLINQEKTVRVYRRIGQDFWSFVGSPENAASAESIFLEILLSFCRALSKGMEAESLEDKVNEKLTQLAGALLEMRFPREHLPQWIRKDFSEDELFWLATGMGAFFDKGI